MVGVARVVRPGAASHHTAALPQSRAAHGAPLRLHPLAAPPAGTSHVDWGWRLSLGLALIPSTILTLGGLLLPDSPTSLEERRRPAEARRVLERVRGTADVDAGACGCRALPGGRGPAAPLAHGASSVQHPPTLMQATPYHSPAATRVCRHPGGGGAVAALHRPAVVAQPAAAALQARLAARACSRSLPRTGRRRWLRGRPAGGVRCILPRPPRNTPAAGPRWCWRR